MTTRAGFEPTTLRSKGFDSTNAPPRPTMKCVVFLLWRFTVVYSLKCSTLYHGVGVQIPTWAEIVLGLLPHLCLPVYLTIMCAMKALKVHCLCEDWKGG